MARNRSASPANGNYDFTLRFERVKLFQNIVKQFDTNILRASQTMREVANTFNAVAGSYSEVCLCVNNTSDSGTSVPGAAIHPSTQNNTVGSPSTISGAMRNNNIVVENYGTRLQSTATVFSSEMRKIKDGATFSKYNESVSGNINKVLHQVITQTTKTVNAGNDCAKHLKTYTKFKRIEEKKVAKYQRLGKPLSESKRYERQAKDAKDAETVYQSKLSFFNELYDELITRYFYVVGHTLDDFLSIHLRYFFNLLTVMTCIAPDGPKEVENFVNDSRKMGKRLGMEESELVGAATGHGRRSKSVHNFTTYFKNRADDDGVEEGPMTARNDDTPREVEKKDDGKKKTVAKPVAAKTIPPKTNTTTITTTNDNNNNDKRDLAATTSANTNTVMKPRTKDSVDREPMSPSPYHQEDLQTPRTGRGAGGVAAAGVAPFGETPVQAGATPSPAKADPVNNNNNINNNNNNNNPNNNKLQLQRLGTAGRRPENPHESRLPPR